MAIMWLININRFFVKVTSPKIYSYLKLIIFGSFPIKNNVILFLHFFNFTTRIHNTIERVHEFYLQWRS